MSNLSTWILIIHLTISPNEEIIIDDYTFTSLNECMFAGWYATAYYADADGYVCMRPSLGVNYD